jgi:hypothetical protein
MAQTRPNQVWVARCDASMYCRDVRDRPVWLACSIGQRTHRRESLMVSSSCYPWRFPLWSLHPFGGGVQSALSRYVRVKPPSRCIAPLGAVHDQGEHDGHF